MIWNFLNPLTFAHETADIKLAYFQSAVSWASVDGFKKFQIMVVENDEKKQYFLPVFYDFEKLASYHLSMNQNFLLFSDKCRVDRFKSNFCFVTPRGRTLHQLIPPPSSLTCYPVFSLSTRSSFASTLILLSCHGSFGIEPSKMNLLFPCNFKMLAISSLRKHSSCIS